MRAAQPDFDMSCTKERHARTDLTTPLWWGARAEPCVLTSFGIKLTGGGAHQSKTMMFGELEALMATGSSKPDDLRSAAIEENAIGKATINTRRLTFRHLASLYGFSAQPPMTKAFMSLWRSDVAGRRLRALLVALARDPLLRGTAPVVLDSAVGHALERPLFEDILAASFPNRFSEKMLRSLAQNCASSWTQSGHLGGTKKKLRQRVTPTPPTVGLAALIATAAGFGGPAILSSGWIKVLDLSPDQALDALRGAEAIGLARVRSAGDVTEISVRQPMAAMLGVPELEHV